jgi:hypothetical protein
MVSVVIPTSVTRIGMTPTLSSFPS